MTVPSASVGLEEVEDLAGDLVAVEGDPPEVGSQERVPMNACEAAPRSRRSRSSPQWSAKATSPASKTRRMHGPVGRVDRADLEAVRQRQVRDALEVGPDELAAPPDVREAGAPRAWPARRRPGRRRSDGRRSAGRSSGRAAASSARSAAAARRGGPPRRRAPGTPGRRGRWPRTSARRSSGRSSRSGRRRPASPSSSTPTQSRGRSQFVRWA